MGIDGLNAYAQRYFSAFEQPPVPIELRHAQAIIAGAVAYARDLGFEPHPDFAAAEPFLGEPPADAPAIGFGRDGMSLYINGPRDNAMGVIAKLRQRCGDGNFHYFLADVRSRCGPSEAGSARDGRGRAERRTRRSCQVTIATRPCAHEIVPVNISDVTHPLVTAIGIAHSGVSSEPERRR